MHGKIYRRKFLKKNNITFNNSRANEDNGFNRLIVFLKAKIGFLDKITYLYRENPNSITRAQNRRYKIDGLEGFVYNMKWTIEESIKRGVTPNIADFSYSVLMALYYDYLRFYVDENSHKIFSYAKSMLDYYLPNKDKIKDSTKEEVTKNKETEFLSYGKELKYVITFDEFIERSINHD